METLRESQEKEKVLVIAHHFPPMGGPGVYRSLMLVKNLPASGYDPVVLTISLEDIKSSGYPEDPTLLQGMEEVSIVRVPTGEKRKLKRRLMRMRLFRPFWFLFYPLFWEPDALWPFSALQQAKDLIAKHNIRVVYTSSGPYAPLLLGYFLKKETGVKWVADLRDPFTDAYAYIWPSKAHWYASRLFEKITLRKADKVIVNTPEVEKLYLGRKLVQPEKITCITNGF